MHLASIVVRNTCAQPTDSIVHYARTKCTYIKVLDTTEVVTTDVPNLHGAQPQIKACLLLVTETYLWDNYGVAL